MNAAPVPGTYHAVGTEIVSDDGWGGIGFVHNEPSEMPGRLEEAEATAVLFAAAPTLLKELRNALIVIAGSLDEECQLCGGSKDLAYHAECNCYPIRSAIAKAESKDQDEGEHYDEPDDPDDRAGCRRCGQLISDVTYADNDGICNTCSEREIF